MPLAFAAPWLLLALAALPALWWLLRHTPPRPRITLFAPFRLLPPPPTNAQQPQSTPWWLLALRIALAACVILALAGPTLSPRMAPAGSSTAPLVLVIDNGWPAAKGWEQRRAVLLREIEAAGRAGAPVLLVPTARANDAIDAPRTAAAAADLLRSLAPRPYLPERAELVAPLAKALEQLGEARILYASDGIATAGSEAFIAFLRTQKQVRMLNDAALLPLALAPPQNGGEALAIRVQRAQTGTPLEGMVQAYDRKGRPLGEAPFFFANDADSATASLTLPVELRNDIARMEIIGEHTAGAVQLLDERWRRRVIGLYSGANTAQGQALLSPLHFLVRATEPFADARESRHSALGPALDEFMSGKHSIIILADTAAIPPASEAKLEAWLRSGGVLLRFAGARLGTIAPTDRFLPVALREGSRSLGGQLTWEQPQPLAPFSEKSPFKGLTPAADIRITRQVLAEAGPELAARTWAELADGTPLVTAQAHGAGWSVLVHVTADPSWSSLPLSGTFLDMLRRIIALSSRAAPSTDDASTAQASTLPPLRSLDAMGRMGPPPANALPLKPAFALTASPNRDHPPGLYGREEALLALNTLRTGDEWKALTSIAGATDIATAPYALPDEVQLKPYLLVLGAMLLLADALAVLWLAGAMPRLPRRALAMVVVALAAFGTAQDSKAQDANVPSAILELKLGYVLTGLADVDEVSKAGMEGLSRALARRTSVRVGSAAGVDAAKDELSFYPLLYWPVDPRQPRPDAATLARIDAYMKNGGTILFDTRDQSSARPDGRGGIDTPGLIALRSMLSSLDVPPLEQVPPDHVLTKTFYLLTGFVGRFDDGPLWTERTPENKTGNKDDIERPVRMADGISPILVTTNDLAGAWAVDERDAPLLPMYGQDTRQREMALRAGINIVLYLLTGNYKADQVHVRDILNRIGK